MTDEVNTLVTDSAISQMLIEMVGFNVANVVYEKLFDNCDVKINCATRA